MSLDDFDPTRPKNLDPKKHGFDYGDGRPVVFNSDLFRECPSCEGKGEVNGEKCITCDGTGAVEKE